MNAPVMFQHMATELCGNIDFDKVFVDDVVTCSQSMAELYHPHKGGMLANSVGGIETQTE